MLLIDNTVFVFIDVQGKLAQLMYEKDVLFDSLRRAIAGMRALGVPLLWVEQIPDKMGSTVPEMRELLAPEKPIAKSSFSCCGSAAFIERLESLSRRQVLLSGIETHVCVYQTAADLAGRGYEVAVMADAVSSRTLSNKLVGLERIRACGACVTSVEMALFELMRSADHPAFRDVLRIVR